MQYAPLCKVKYTINVARLFANLPETEEYYEHDMATAYCFYNGPESPMYTIRNFARWYQRLRLYRALICRKVTAPETLFVMYSQLMLANLSKHEH